MAQKKFPEAIKAYEGFHARAKTATSLIKLHVGYVAAGRPDEGDVRLAQWLKDSPGDNAARNYAADYALSRGKYREAIAQYELLRQKQPDNARLLNNLSWAYFQTKDARALGIAERAYKISPDNSAVADTLGTQLIDKGDFTRGIEILEKAVKAAPKSPEIHYHLALGWIKAGDKSKARGALERAFSISEKFSNSAEAKDLLNQLRN